MSDRKLSDMRMLNDGVLVKPHQNKEIGGILIPLGAGEEKTKGVVINCGPGRWKDREKGIREPMQVKPGDHIFHSQFAGSEVKIDGVKYLTMPEEDVFAVYVGGDSVRNLKTLNNRVLIEWEEATDFYCGKSKIARGGKDNFERHYTGIVLAVGPDSRDVEVGKRIFFDQFCGPERIDEGGKRYAFILDNDAYCEVPERTQVEVLSQ